MRKKTAARRTTRLAGTLTELAAATPVVMAQRARRLLAGTDSAADRAETRLMMSEKWQAWNESWTSMAFAYVRAAQQMFTQPLSWAMGTTAQRRAVTARAQSQALEIFAAGVRPVHRIAVANAKRLSRAKAR